MNSMIDFLGHRSAADLRPLSLRPALSAEVHVCQAHCPMATCGFLRSSALLFEALACFPPPQRRTAGAPQSCICSLLDPEDHTSHELQRDRRILHQATMNRKMSQRNVIIRDTVDMAMLGRGRSTHF